MTAFLAAVVASISEWFLSKFLSFVGEEIALKQEDQKIKEEALNEQKKISDASTPEQIADAAASSAAGAFKQ